MGINHNDKVSIKKIPLKELINTLIKIYEEGADFIDIAGAEVSATKDTLYIGVAPEYYNNADENENIPEEYKKIDLLTEEDFNNLI